MTKEEKDTAIQSLEKILSNGLDNYHLNDGQVIIQNNYKSADDLLKAIDYFKSAKID